MFLLLLVPLAPTFLSDVSYMSVIRPLVYV